MLAGELTVLIQVAELGEFGTGTEEHLEIGLRHVHVARRDIHDQRVGPAVVRRWPERLSDLPDEPVAQDLPDHVLDIGALQWRALRDHDGLMIPDLPSFGKFFQVLPRDRRTASGRFHKRLFYKGL